MKFDLHPDQKQGTLSLSGEITLLRAREVLALLTQALEASEHLTIDTTGVTDIDTAGLQLLCAAHKSASERGKRLTIHPDPPQVLLSRARQAGLEGQRACGELKNTNCLFNGRQRTNVKIDTHRG